MAAAKLPLPDLTLDRLDGAASADLLRSLMDGILSEGSERDLLLEATRPVLGHIAHMHAPPPIFLRRGPSWALTPR